MELENSRPRHPVLDDPTKMMRIIANPLYDKLTISRAAHMQKLHRTEFDRKLIRLNRQKEKAMVTSNDHEETIALTLPITNQQIRPKSASGHQNSPPNGHTRSIVRTDNQPNHSSSLENDKTVGSTIRYVNSRHGFEVQRYSSHNWLSVDILSKDACQSHEKTFRDMLDKQEQSELISHNIYTLDYYRQRYRDLLQSYKQGSLTHDQWAKQNYQLYCLKTFYTRAFNREQYLLDMHAKKLRQRRAQNVFNQWREAKDKGVHGHSRNHLNIANGQHRIEITSAVSDPSVSLPNTTINRLSTPLVIDNVLEDLSVHQSMNSSKYNTNMLYMLDKRRSSLQAMLKRVVGLAEPLPPPPSKNTNPQSSSMTSWTSGSGFESNL